MADCDNSVKRTENRWWMRTPTKGGSLPSNGQRNRPVSQLQGSAMDRTESQPSQARHLPNQSRLPIVDGHSQFNKPSSPAGGDKNNVSQLLKEVIVQRVEVERSLSESKSLVVAPEPEVLRAPEVESSVVEEPMIEIPGWKRALDLTLIVLTYPIWLPLMLLVMAAIKISSPGPIFYRQERVGFRGRTFMIFKFRSMKVHAQTSKHEWYFQRLMRDGTPMTKLDAGDPRIIPWGRFLRASGLDELPQIFNVIRGEMSLVGPRPCTRVEFESYEEWQQERVNTLPGLTGYWQVNGKNKTTFQQMIEMDLFYAKNLSLGLDFWVMAKTPAALFGQMIELLQQRAATFGKLSGETQTVPIQPSDRGTL